MSNRLREDDHLRRHVLLQAIQLLRVLLFRRPLQEARQSHATFQSLASLCRKKYHPADAEARQTLVADSCATPAAANASANPLSAATRMSYPGAVSGAAGSNYLSDAARSNCLSDAARSNCLPASTHSDHLPAAAHSERLPAAAAAAQVSRLPNVGAADHQGARNCHRLSVHFAAANAAEGDHAEESGSGHAPSDSARGHEQPDGAN